MAFIPVANSARVTITYQNDNLNQCVNVLWFRDNEDVLTVTRAQVMSSLIADWLQTEWADVANVNWSAVRVETRGMDTESAAYDDEALAIPGTLTGEPLPSEVTLAVSLRTGLTGRSFRGRVYHVGVGEANSAGDYISSGYRTNLISAYAQLLTMASALEFTWCVCSLYSGGAPRESGILTPITGIVIVDQILDSQRRRKPKL